MIPLFPLMLFGSGLFLATKTAKKKASSFKLIETGSVARLPKVDQPLITMDLHPNQMIELIAASSPSDNWVSEVEGESVKVDKSVRAQDPVTQTSAFSIKSLTLGDSRVVFKKIGREGEVLEARHLGIAVMR